ncbi:MAG: cobalt ECF transporter T component CbiQ [Treponema sp.]|nr:cobalt ECF transporter T component CbiQ [Treponema sp.]
MDFYRKAGGIGRLEVLASGDSPVHRLHPGAKIVTTLVYIGAVVSFPARDLSGLGIFILYPAVLMSLSGTPWKALLARLLVSLPFALTGAIGNLVMLREPVFSIGAFTVTAGMLSFFSILYRTFLAVLAALILVATTPFPDFIRQLGRMGMPRIFCLQTTMTWRYLSVLLSEAGTMYTAYLLRSEGRKGIGMKNMGSFLGLLLVRSFDRAGRVYQAMKNRGFDGARHTGAVRPLRLSDGLFAGGICSAAVFFRLFNAGDFLGGILAGFGGG